MFLNDGNLNRQELGKIIFSDSTQRKKLEDILHPRINKLFHKKVKEILKKRLKLL